MTLERQAYATVEIVDVFLPFTWSAAMKVVLHKRTADERIAVLKLYDRRYCPELREDYDKPPWRLNRDEEYFDFVKSGGATEFISHLRGNDDYDDADWDVARHEAWIYDRCYKLWKTESDTYQILHDLQGLCVPRLFQKVIFDPMTLPSATVSMLEVPGILIEFIDGFNLDDMYLHVPQEQWQSVCTQAIEVVHRISNHNVLNEDARTRNMIVRKSNKERADIECGSGPGTVDSYDVFAIDFGLCRLRRPDESDDEWKKAKWRQHEEENLGLWMQAKAKRDHGVEIECRSTRQYDGPWVLERLADDYTYEEFLLAKMYGAIIFAIPVFG